MGRKEFKLFDYTFSKTGKFSSFTFIFRVLQYKQFFPKNVSDITPQNFTRKETI